jgi:LmbE family N-acetylglucosaminyl deacetylase
MSSPIKTADDVKQLGAILCVWAHPDDETFSCAGIMAAAIRNGQQVACITATKGEAGVQDASQWPAEQLGEIRTREMAKALDLIGCKNHHWLGYKDGECDKVPAEEGADRVREFIKLYKPDSILTFGPDGMTGHPDHQAVSRWATQAAGNKVQVYYAVQDQEIYDKYLIEIDKQFNFFFNIDKPPLRPSAECDIAFRLTEDLSRIKDAALRAMPSQTKLMLDKMPNDFVSSVFCIESFVKA